MFSRSTIPVLAALAMAWAPVPALALADAPADLLPSYTGPAGDHLDILSVSATFDGTHFHLGATLAGAPGAMGSLYVFGIDRGAGTPRLSFGVPSIGGGVLFDAVAVLFPDGTGRIATFPAIGAPTITTLPGLVSTGGNAIWGSFAAGLLPSRGFDPADYRFTLWSRQRVNPAMDGTAAEIADFAPAAGGFVATAVPEPASWVLMIGGLAGAGGLLRRRSIRAMVAPG